MQFQKRLGLLVVTLMLATMLAFATPGSAMAATPDPIRGGFGDPAFDTIFTRTDVPVISGAVGRSAVWGYELIRKWQEPYKEARGGSRVVAYYDKARMEITYPDGNNKDRFYVTNGLLVRELISGFVQLGDDTYQQRTPASNVAIAGDPLIVNANAPTYASLSNIASLNNDRPSPQKLGQTVTETLLANGNIGINGDLAKYNVKYAEFNPTLQHNIPDVFVNFLNLKGPVIENGQLVTGTVIDGLTAVGLPLTEAFWVRARVAGNELDVMLQAFERRVLTYTPGNPKEFQVEMGNVGLHYYNWRYLLEPFRNKDTVVEANGGLVSTANPYAAEVGAQVLRNGGNAIDAATAIMFALGVVEPQSSGIGGGGFMLIRTKTGQTVMIDSRETMPAAATSKLFLNPDDTPMAFNTARLSGKAVGVPGAVKGAEYALKNYGTWKLADVISPATTLAEDGFLPTPRFIEAISDPTALPVLNNSDAAKAIFLPDGKPVAAGTKFKQPDLAKTYKLIAKDGAAAFYGDTELAKALVKAVQDKGGIMTLDDVKKYDIKARTPVSGSYRGYEIISAAPPSSGGLTILYTLKLLEPYDLKQYGQNSAEVIHLFSEASRLAFADRAKWMGDEDFVKVPKKGLLSSTYLDERRKLLSPNSTAASYAAGDPTPYDAAAAGLGWQSDGTLAQDGRETTHVVVSDRDGNVVTFTTTIESGYGTGIVVPGYGFLLNNEMTDFDFVPGTANEVAPGKRPRSSMSPTIVLKDGKPFIALGSPGGSTIIPVVGQVIMNVVDFGMSLPDAINAPRTVGTGPASTVISWEPGVSKAVRDKLKTLGHTISDNPSVWTGSVQGVYLGTDGKKTGAADWRRDGTVVGVK
jgi:gamma-glutamyltranspeptidase/glutathione hydrolase